MVKSTVETTKTKKAKVAKTARPVGRPAKSKSLSQRLEDLKLGKFAESDDFCLPEKETKRGWQILGGMVMLLTALMGVGCLLLMPPLNYLLNPSPMSFLASLLNEKFYWKIASAAVIILIICCLVASVMLFVRKRVPTGIWYVLVGVMMIILVCLSFHTFRHYEQRECYKNYPNIIELDYSCPSVVGELSGIVAKDLLVFTLGMVALYLIHRNAKQRYKSTKK